MITIKNFKIIAFLEGLSYILLLFMATPIKYLFDMPIFVRALGMPHGVLFILYLIFAFLIHSEEKKWSNKDLAIILISSVIPFGTFYVSKQYLKS